MKKETGFLVRPMIPVAGQLCEVETPAKKGKVVLFVDGERYAEQTAKNGSVCFQVRVERAAF